MRWLHIAGGHRGVPPPPQNPPNTTPSQSCKLFNNTNKSLPDLPSKQPPSDSNHVDSPTSHSCLQFVNRTVSIGYYKQDTTTPPIAVLGSSDRLTSNRLSGSNSEVCSGSSLASSVECARSMKGSSLASSVECARSMKLSPRRKPNNRWDTDSR